jgi:lipopolysaccharide export system permease protein
LGRYDRYFLSQLLVLFSFFSLVLVSVYWVNRAVGLFDRLVADGQNMSVFLEFTALSLPYIILLVLPVAGFVAALYATNRMIAESEMVVLQTAGLSALRLLRPVAVFGLIIAAVLTILAHVLVPASRTQLVDRGAEISQDLTSQLLREGQFLHPTEGLTVYIRDITELGEFRDLFLQDRSNPMVETTYTAQRALLVRTDDGPRLVMFDGLAQSLRLDGRRLSIIEFDDFAYDLGRLVDLTDTRRYGVRELSTGVLLAAEPDVIEAHRSTRAAFLYEAHNRFARAIFAGLVPMIGAVCLMLGAFSRFGSWPQILLAVSLILPLHMMENVAENLAVQNADLVFMAYVQSVLAAIVLVVVTWFAMRPNLRPKIKRAVA